MLHISGFGMEKHVTQYRHYHVVTQLEWQQYMASAIAIDFHVDACGTVNNLL